MFKKILYSLAIFIFALSLSPTVFAEAIPDGAGIVYGQGFGFNLQAPKGWTLDNSSAQDQGLTVVFYPNGSNWADSKIVAYAKSRPKTSSISTADDVAKDTVKHFHENGMNSFQGKYLKTIKTAEGKDAVIYQFSGDQWGNSEAAAYLIEKERINFIVISSRDKALFDQSLPAFEALVKSYKPLAVTVAPPPAK